MIKLMPIDYTVCGEDEGSFGLDTAIFRSLNGLHRPVYHPYGETRAIVSIPVIDMGILLERAGVIDRNSVYKSAWKKASDEEIEDRLDFYVDSERCIYVMEAEQTIRNDEALAYRLMDDYDRAVKNGWDAIAYLPMEDNNEKD